MKQQESRHGWWLGMILFILPVLGHATPYVPKADSEVLEQLPNTVADTRARDLRTLRQALAEAPDNLTLAVQLARDYVEIGRETGDPRYAGYAQSVLTPWWTLLDPPAQVLVLRAQLRQRSHQFDLALVDLDRVLLIDSRAADARLLRATIRQVIGDYPGATNDCAALRGLVSAPLVTHCEAIVLSVTGKLQDAYEMLAETSLSLSGFDPPTRAWILTSLAEMAARLAQPDRASEHFKDALAIAPSDQYLLIAYTDFLLDTGRAAAVIPLLAPYARVDGLLLRYTLALQATGRATSEPAAQLRARYAAGAARGETAHQREEARFALEIEQNPTRALELALANWRVQKEPPDLRLLITCARVMRNDAALQIAREWIAQTRYEDKRLDFLQMMAASPARRP